MSITIHQVRDLALKILGLYCVLGLLVQLSGAAYVTALIPDETYPGNAVIELAQCLANAAIYLIAAYLLLFRTQLVLRIVWPTPEPESEAPFAPRLASLEFWFQLLGVFFVVRSLPAVASAIAFWLFNSDTISTSTVYGRGGTIDSAVTLALAVICIRWPNALVRVFRPGLFRDEEVENS